MNGVSEASQYGAGTAPLYGALAEGCRIGKLVMVEDVIDVEALDAGMEAVEPHAIHPAHVGVAYLEVAYLVVIARLAVVEVYAEKVGIEADVEFLALAVVM